MKIKNRIILLIALIIPLIMAIMITNVTATISDLSVLKGTGSSYIGEVFMLTYSTHLSKREDMYCMQKGKHFKNVETAYILKDYIELNGKQATVYSEKNSSGKVIYNDLNAQMAYLLNLKQGYGTHDNPTEAQNAIWHISNDWNIAIFENSNNSWAGNAEVAANTLNDDAITYASSIGSQLASSDDSSSSTTTNLSMADKTDSSKLTVSNIGGYYRVGPFRWEFDGILQGIAVTGNAGNISSARFVKYIGTTATVVNVSQIQTGEAFYVDIPQSSGSTQLRGLTLKTSSSGTGSSSTVYTAKIWFLQASGNQNLIYVDVGNSLVNPSQGTGSGQYNIPLSTGIGLKKVDDREQSVPLFDVGFQFKATVKKYEKVGTKDIYNWVSHMEPDTEDIDNDGDTEELINKPKWELIWVQNIYEWKYYTKYLNKSGSEYVWGNSPQTFYTNNAGMISVNNIKYSYTQVTNESWQNQIYNRYDEVDGNTVKAIEVSNPYYGYTTGNTYTLSLNSGTQLANKTVTNHQKLVKLSGYVWLDSATGKISISTEKHEIGEAGVDGVNVYLKNSSGTIIKSTTTSELGLYSEINGGEYRFTDVDLDALQAGNYYVEFEYCGITYQSVGAVLNENTGSKAIDTSTRNVLDNKFASVNASGNQSLNINGVTVNYKGISNHVSSVDSHTGCNVYARTNEAGYDLYSGFTPTSEEIRYVNLGLYRKPQTDYALSQDLYDVRIDVNAYSHVYRYGMTRYIDGGNTIDQESSWNVGVKFQKNSGTYDRAIYKSDAEYEAPNHQDNEIKVYVTYKIALRNESAYLGRINNIVNYCDNRYELIAAGTSIDDKDNISGNVSFSNKSTYNNEYSKYIINANSVIQSGQTNYLYVQFKIERAGVLAILNNGELLNNVVEINSYTTFKNNNVNSPVSVIDADSVVGNAIPGQINTYEDDTDAARSLKLELKNERALIGTVFVDSTGKDSNVYTGQERLGNGIFDDGEKTLEGIKVTLREVGKDDSSYDGERILMETTTDANGNFEFRGYIPGNYTVTYTWGNNEYKVQYYKGTVYDETRNQNNGFWYRDDNVDIRKTDALDSSSIREKIDDEMEALKYNILENEISKAYNGGSNYIQTTTMDSTTPVMNVSVEYLTTVTDGIGDQVVFTIRNVDFGIVERPKQKLDLSKRVSGYKITLANGQILVDAEITEDGQLVGTYDYTTYMGPVSVDIDGKIRTEMDTELIEGATLEVIYEIKVTNISELDYVSDRYYYYGNNTNSDYVRNSITQLVDYLDGRLAILENESKWAETDKVYLTNVNASQKDNDTYLNLTRTYLTTQLSKDLAPNESNAITLKASKLLTSTDDNTFNNQSEITEVTKAPGFNTGGPVQIVLSENSFNFNEDNAETIIIIPSTGENRAFVLPTVIGISSLLILAGGIFVIKKFIIDNK